MEKFNEDRTENASINEIQDELEALRRERLIENIYQFIINEKFVEKD